MHEIYELKEMLCEELEKYGSKGDLSTGELEIVDKLAHAVKNLGKIIEMYEDEEYSGAYAYEDGMMGGSYRRGGRGDGSSRGGSSSNRGGSYARGDGRSRRGENNPTGRNQYSREQGYSRADEMGDMIESIRGMMGELPQEVQRDAQRFVQKLEQHMM